MAVQAKSRPERTRHAYTVNGDEACCGGVEVDRRAGTVTVDSAATRDPIGQRLTRVFDVSAHTLVLTPAIPARVALALVTAAGCALAVVAHAAITTAPRRTADDGAAPVAATDRTGCLPCS